MRRDGAAARGAVVRSAHSEPEEKIQRDAALADNYQSNEEWCLFMLRQFIIDAYCRFQDKCHSNNNI